MVPIPDTDTQADLVSKLDDWARAIEGHELWTPPNPHPSLFHTWDFVKRSHYIMSEIENIRLGKELKFPDQIPPNKDGELSPPPPPDAKEGAVPRLIHCILIRQQPRMMRKGPE